MAGLRTFRTQLWRLLVDADHLPRQFLQLGLRVELLVVKFDRVPQLSNPAAPRLRAQESGACRGDKTQISNRVLRRAQVHRVQHIDANELGRKPRQREQRVDTDPLLGLARQELRCAVSGRPPCCGGRGVGQRNVTAVGFAPPANFLGRLPFEAEQGFVPSPVATHLEQQRMVPQSLLLATTSSPRFVGAQPLRLVVPRRW